MRRGWAVLLALVLAGCAEPPREPLEAPPADWRRLPELSAWSIVSHTNGSVAIRAAIHATKETTCKVFFAVHRSAAFSADFSHSAEIQYGDSEVYAEGGAGVRGPYSTRIRVQPVDTRPVLNGALDAAFGVVRQTLGGGDTYTSTTGLGEVTFDPGRYNLTLQSPIALDGGPEETLGGSMRIAATCTAPLTIEALLEDPHALWLSGTSMDGDLDASVDPFLVDAHRGSLDHSTTNASRVEAVSGRSQTTLRISGAINLTQTWTPNTDLRQPRLHWNGPPGDYHLAWDSVGAGLAHFDVRILSFGSLPPSALVLDGSMPSWV